MKPILYQIFTRLFGNDTPHCVPNGSIEENGCGKLAAFTPEALAATFVAGAKLQDGQLVTSGGRVTGTPAIAGSLEEAIREAYRLSEGVTFEGAYKRSDIGQRALQALK